VVRKLAGLLWGIDMKKAHYNQSTGEILGFYETEIHNEIPEPVLDLTEAEWEAAVNSRHKVVNGALVQDPVILTYVDKRSAEYPDFREYLDGIVKGDQTQVQAYIDACNAVKQKYPKP
jgi:hypothetical protein